MDLASATRNKLRTHIISPLLSLALIDSTVNCCVSQSVELPIKLPCSLSCVVDFFLIPLDGSCAVVLGYSWLQKQNPLINWQNKTIKLQNQTSEPNQELILKDSMSKPKKPHISLITVMNFWYTCKWDGVITGQLQLTKESDLLDRSSKVGAAEPNLEKIPNEYWQFVEVFSKAKSKQLPPH